MSLDEIKAAIETLTPEERAELVHWLKQRRDFELDDPIRQQIVEGKFGPLLAGQDAHDPPAEG
jgi:hypothetical protein